MENPVLDNARSMLNDAQREAVETIEGPVMVVAGAGTGKTQLLSLRVAEILEKTDTKPEQILCVTFTENGARNLRSRLVDFIGNEAFQLKIGTFHQLAVEIMNDYSYYIQDTMNYQPADSLIQLQITDAILAKLPTDNPLHSKNPQGSWVFQRGLLEFISDMKKRGIDAETADQILEENKNWFLEKRDLLLQLSERIKGKRSINKQLIEPIITEFITPKHVFKQSLYLPIADWYSAEFERLLQIPTDGLLLKELRDLLKGLVFKYQGHSELKPLVTYGKQKQAIACYKQYQKELYRQGYHDFDDLLLTAIKAADSNEALQYELYEKFLYLMVDEYQDTSGVQMQFLKRFIDQKMWEGRPNILVVGDDDQAIFGFQGATLDNIMSFQQDYPDARVIPLINNYRSRQEILSFACGVIEQAGDRIVHRIPDLNKQLISMYSYE